MEKIFNGEICKYFRITESIGQKGPYATIKIVDTNELDNHTAAKIALGFHKYVSLIAKSRVRGDIPETSRYNTVLDLVHIADVDKDGISAVSNLNEWHKSFNKDTPIKILNCQNQVYRKFATSHFNIKDLVMSHEFDGL